MEVSPVKETKPPKYPRMDEVSPESIKEALPRRWSANRAAKAALAALAIPALTDIAVWADGRELSAATLSPMPEETDGQMAEVTMFVTDGVPMPPAMPPAFSIWPYIAAAGIMLWITASVIGVAVCIRRNNKEKKSPGEGKVQPAESKNEQEYDEGEY